MTLENLRKLAKAITPGVTDAKIPPDLMDIVINSIVDDIAAYTKCLPTNQKFAVTADTSEYDLATLLTRYFVPDKPGLWWNNGDQWVKVYPRTLQWLDENRPNWRDLDSGDPQDYTIDKNILTVVPAPDTTLASGFWLYFGQSPNAMTANGNYPFTGSSTEYTFLRTFDWAIIYGARWKFKAMIDKYRDEFNQDRQLYLEERERAYSILKRRPDISAEARMQG